MPHLTSDLSFRHLTKQKYLKSLFSVILPPESCVNCDIFTPAISWVVTVVLRLLFTAFSLNSCSYFLVLCSFWSQPVVQSFSRCCKKYMRLCFRLDEPFLCGSQHTSTSVYQQMERVKERRLVTHNAFVWAQSMQKETPGQQVTFASVKRVHST